MRTAQTAQTASPTGLLTTNELCAATGATLREIQWWCQEGMLQPDAGRRQGGGLPIRVFEPFEVAMTRLALCMRHYPKAKRRAIAAVRRAHSLPRYLVIEGRTGKKIHFAATNAEVLELAKAARGGVIVAEVKA
jgi:hypothetical protein